MTRNRKEEIAVLVAKTTTIEEEFYEALADILDVPAIDEEVKTYIKEHYETKLIEGPFLLQGAKASLLNMYTFKELYNFWEGEESKDMMVPIMHLGQNGQYEQLFVLAETGQIISVHMDSLIEDSFVYGENEGYNPKAFLLELAKDYCLLTLSKVLALQQLLVEFEDIDAIIDEEAYTEMRALVAKCFGWTLEELDKRTVHPGVSFLYNILEED